MARDHARILTSIWSDPEFRARTRDEQWLFFRVLSDRHINNAGVLPLFESKWARAAADTDQHAVETARRGLVAHRFLIVDEDTDEALVRSFLRGDRVYRQPNVLKNALGEAPVVESALLRRELAVELHRIVPMLPTGKGFEGMPEEVRRTAFLLDPDGIGARETEPSRNPSADPSYEPRGNPSNGASPNPNASRGVGEGAGVGAGASPSGDLRLGGSQARETADPASRPSASGGPPTPSTSGVEEHPGWPEQPCGHRHDPDRPCGRCGRARRAEQDAAAEASQAEADERAQRVQAAERCSCRRTGGWIEDAAGTPVVRCDHQRDPAAQLADALDHAS